MIAAAYATTARSERIGRREWVRSCGLLFLALISAVGYWSLWSMVGDRPGRAVGVAVIMLLLALPYAGASWWIIARPAPEHPLWRAVEWLAIVGGACAFLAMVFPFHPLLSDDLYRYVWDARLTSHHLSPYLLPPAAPALHYLRDGLVYPHLYWVRVPTIYPPGAQGLFLASYLAVPSSVWAIKGEMLFFVAILAVVLGLLLQAQGHDPRRIIVVLWSPLLIVEVGMNGHVDASAVALWVSAVVVSQHHRWRAARPMVGALLALATLVKLYPALLLLALARRRDRSLYLAFGLTLVLGYAPFLAEGLRAGGFLSTYLSQVEGGVPLAAQWLLSPVTSSRVPVYGVVLLLTALALVGIVIGRWRDALSDEMAVLVVVTAWLALSPQMLPWYAIALLPLCAVFLRSPITSPLGSLVFGLWVFLGVAPLHYIANSGGPEWLASVQYPVAAAAAFGVYGAHRARCRLSTRKSQVPGNVRVVNEAAS
ncbi:MAG: hypothetical protein M3Z66_08245 [Chloroflexota bacterium]|nr:hypothetical protein [Chloroflexota bacterium]